RRIGEELGGQQPPDLPVPEQRNPGFRSPGAGRTRGAYVLSFGRGNPAVPFRRVVKPEPDRRPDKSQTSRDQEDPAPTQFDGDEGNKRRSHRRPDARAGVEDAECERAFPGGEPFGNRFGRSRKPAAFSQPESEPRRPESKSIRNQAMSGVGYRPPRNGRR